MKTLLPSRDLVRFVPAGLDPLQVIQTGMLHTGQIAESYRQWRITVLGGLYIDPGLDANHPRNQALALRSRKEKGQVYRILMVSSTFNPLLMSYHDALIKTKHDSSCLLTLSMPLVLIIMHQVPMLTEIYGIKTGKVM